MKRLIYSVLIEIPSTDWGIGHPLRHIYWDFKDKIVEYKKRYADHCLADYKLFEDFGDFETFPEMSVYDNIQYYKLHLLKELAKEYDEVLYLDFDVIPMQPINFFTTFDLQSYLCLKSKTYPINRDIFKQTPSSRRGYVASFLLDEMPRQYINYNTGVVGGSNNILSKIPFFQELSVVIPKLQITLFPDFTNLTDNAVRYSNEAILTYIIKRYNIPTKNIGEIWNNDSPVEENCFLRHFGANKQLMRDFLNPK